jgi:SpoVK/Ycf46/Vps4 family AAA+-type ATPase
VTAEPLIPRRFAEAIDQHLVFNYAGIRSWPLVLGIFGRPGDGKSFQVRTQLERRGVKACSINAADLESDRAGMPGKLVLDVYENAGHRLDESTLAAVIVDDFDTTVGEWQNSTTTVNHQQVLAQIMHLADNPTNAAGKRIRRVPVFITGNDLSKVYPPLRRPGRMRAFPWLPDEAERKAIVAALLSELLSEREVSELLTTIPEAPIAFFSELHVEVLADASIARVRDLASQLQSLTQQQGGAAREFEQHLKNVRPSAQKITELALRVWHERALATQSHLYD